MIGIKVLRAGTGRKAKYCLTKNLIELFDVFDILI